MVSPTDPEHIKMRLRFHFASILSIVLLMSGSAVYAQDVGAQISQYMTAVVKAYHFMGAILVARDGKVLIARGYGMANLQHHVPNTTSTEFRVASLTKAFTAMAILQLQAKGELNIEDKACKYVPSCPRDWHNITIYDLLTHTSGIPDFTSFSNYRRFETRPTTPAGLLADFENKPLDFKPGTRYKYSSSGYVVLGYIIQRVSGESYQKFLKKNIFDPLGMEDSGYDSSHPIGYKHAKGYVYSHGKYRAARYINMTVPYSAGALYSTVGDLYTWDRALEAGKLLPKSLLKQMFAPQVPMGTLEDLHYGFGWVISREFGYRVVWHGGRIAGFGSFNSWLPDQHAYIIVLDNVSSQVAAEMARSLTAILFRKRYEMPRVRHTITLPAKELRRFVGVYQLSPTFSIAIKRIGDQLKEQATGESAFPIYPESRTGFFMKVADVQIRFVISAKGAVTGLVLRQNGHTFRGRRVD